MPVSIQMTLIICVTVVLVTYINRNKTPTRPPETKDGVKGSKPTPEQKKLMDAAFFSSADWLVEKDTPTFLRIVDRQTGKVQFIPKDGTVPVEK